MTRRRFNRIIASAVMFCCAGWIAAQSDIPRFLKALKGQTFPGKLRPLDDAELRKPGKWLG